MLLFDIKKSKIRYSDSFYLVFLPVEVAREATEATA
jgi:hypothetical protein